MEYDVDETWNMLNAINDIETHVTKNFPDKQTTSATEGSIIPVGNVLCCLLVGEASPIHTYSHYR